ncbi:MAG: MFS transporter [Armatimonadota bacterium]
MSPEIDEQALEIEQSERVTERGFPAAELRRALWLIFVAWIFGAGFLAIISGAALTSFLTKYLRTDDFTYGLIMAAGPAAVLFFFLGSYVNERTGRIKRNFLIFVTLHRLLWLGVAAIPLLMTDWPASAKIAVAGAIIFISAAAANFGGAGWLTWMADIVPRRTAGTFFGNRASVGMISMVVTTVGVAFLLDRYPGQGWIYTVVFGAAAVLGAVDILFFLKVREVPRPVEAQLPTLRDILVTPWKHAAFRSFALYTCAAWISYMTAAPFMWRFTFEPLAERGLGMSLSQANLALFIIPTLAMALASPLWGRAVDRFGPKPVLAVSSLGAILFPLPWLVMHHDLVGLLYVMSVLGGLSWPGIDQAMQYMQVKGFPDERRTAYCASYQVVFGLACVIGTTLGGLLASFWQAHASLLAGLPDWVSHYHPVFATSIVLRILAFVFLLLPMRLPGSTDGMRRVARAVTTEMPLTLPGLGGKRRPK